MICVDPGAGRHQVLDEGDVQVGEDRQQPERLVHPAAAEASHEPAVTRCLPQGL
jgi:hypothetical protein